MCKCLTADHLGVEDGLQSDGVRTEINCRPKTQIEKQAARRSVKIKAAIGRNHKEARDEEQQRAGEPSLTDEAVENPFREPRGRE